MKEDEIKEYELVWRETDNPIGVYIKAGNYLYAMDKALAMGYRISKYRVRRVFAMSATCKKQTKEQAKMNSKKEDNKEYAAAHEKSGIHLYDSMVLACRGVSHSRIGINYLTANEARGLGKDVYFVTEDRWEIA